MYAQYRTASRHRKEPETPVIRFLRPDELTRSDPHARRSARRNGPKPWLRFTYLRSPGAGETTCWTGVGATSHTRRSTSWIAQPTGKAVKTHLETTPAKRRHDALVFPSGAEG